MKTLATILLIVRRSLRQHFLSTVVTVVAVALASGLMMSVFAINTQARKAFVIDDAGFDAVLGARGSALQLVLNAVYHLETSPGNISWRLYQDVSRQFGVELAIPYVLGDNYHGHRIVGTTPELFTKFAFREGQQFTFSDGGKVFDADKREAVIGSHAAQKTGLRKGSTFHAYHGLVYDEAMKHDAEFTVVGVLEATNTPADRVIWIPIESAYRMEGHVLRGSGDVFVPEQGVEIPDEHKEVSAVMLKFNGPMVGMMLGQMINHQGTEATLASPVAAVMLDLFDKIGWVNRVLELVAYLVVIVAAAGILASIYNTMHDRRREFAILRALGARRPLVFSVILLQSAAIAMMGTLLGYLVYAAIIGTAATIVREQVGVVISVVSYDPILWITPLTMLVVGLIAGILPAIKAYKTDVAGNLLPTA